MGMAALVPVQLDALFVRDTIAVVGPTLPYDRAPHHAGGREQNADVPYLGSALARAPFRDHGQRIEPGLHLHWAMPDVLMRLDEHGNAPALPNRWMVHRVPGHAPLTERTWVIESDAVRFGPRPDGPCAGIPWPGDVPNAWLGTTRDLGDGAIDVPDRLAPLTFLVGGEATFAALYSRCAGVFGLHDTEVAGGIPPGTRYYVWGFYDDASADIVVRVGRGVRTAKQALKDDLGWALDIDDAQHSMFFAMVDLPQGTPVAAAVDPKVDVAFGNNAEEAVAALFSPQVHTQEAIGAIRFLAATGHTDTDLEHALADFTHGEGFHASRGGHRWVLRSRPAPPDASVRPEGPRLAELLSRLAAAQRDYDDAHHHLAALCHTLYLDWCRYLTASYPPEGGSIEDFPDIDEIRDHVERDVLDRIEALAARAGRVAFDDHARPRVEAPGDLATLIFELWHGVRDQLPTAGGAPLFDLVLAPGPRFWTPSEPAIAISGPSVRPTDRHRADGQGYEHNLLPCGSVWIEAEPDDPPHAYRDVWGWIRARYDAGWRYPSTTVVTEDPWHPLVLEWEAFFHALGDERSSSDEPYDPAVIERQFVHDSNLPDLRPRGRVPSWSTTDPLGGWTLLTRGAPQVIAEALDRYLEELTAHAAEEAEVVAELRAVHAALGDGRALQSCALSGFNRALVMRRRGPHLPVADPLAMPESDRDRFARRVAAWTGGVRDEPDPALEMHPLRTGSLALGHLAVVDSFGRRVQLEITAVHRAHTMGEGLGTGHVLLPPRFLHPTRLRFRWLDASPDGRESTDHPSTTPVRGWLICNLLDERMLVFDAAGGSLGSLRTVDGSVRVDILERWRLDPVLDRTIDRITRHGVEHFGSFFDAIGEAQELIDPGQGAHHQGLAMLVGRPIAVTRARVDLETAGNLPHSQSWESFSEVLAGAERDRCGLDRVRVPVRLGARPEAAGPHRLDDSLLGFWVDGDDVFRAPKSTATGTFIGPFHDTDHPPVVAVSAAGPPVEVTMLVDPRGRVHAASGVVPTKALGLDAAHVAPALERMEVSFEVGPILTRAGHLDYVEPTDPDLQWEWIDEVGDRAGTAIEPLTDQPELAPDLELRAGLVRLRPRRSAPQ